MFGRLFADYMDGVKSFVRKESTNASLRSNATTDAVKSKAVEIEGVSKWFLKVRRNQVKRDDKTAHKMLYLAKIYS